MNSSAATKGPKAAMVRPTAMSLRRKMMAVPLRMPAAAMTGAARTGRVLSPSQRA